ncbi:MAG: hypothetical protein MJZ23_08075 [Paludibacteraceae bacterium]|nr:hypothetical protein [Paludibacteraceae bacterium]
MTELIQNEEGVKSVSEKKCFKEHELCVIKIESRDIVCTSDETSDPGAQIPDNGNVWD